MAKKKPTTAELEILKVLWESGPSSVRHVHDALSVTRDVFYTTTLKVMQVMFAKKLLTRDDSQRSHIYAPAVKQRAIEKHMLDGMINTLFDGSAKQMIVSVLGHSTPTQEELDEIKSLIEKLDENVVD